MHASRLVRPSPFQRLPATCLAFGLVLGLGACATDPFAADPDIPPGAVESVRTEANGDLVTEYRVAGQLRVVRVQPERGPTYYLYDRNGDGRLDSSEGEGPVSPVYFKLYEW